MKKGYYLSGIDSNSKCLKCLSTCEECESLNVCTKCKEGLILNKDSCVTCLSLNEGCEECSQINNKCKKCYNNKMLKYELTNNHKCKKKMKMKIIIIIKIKTKLIYNLKDLIVMKKKIIKLILNHILFY